MAATRQKTAVILGSLVDRTSDFAALALLAVAGFVVAWNPSSPHHGQDDPTDWVPFAVGGAVAVVAVIAGIVAWRRWHPHGRAHKLLLEFFVALRHLRAHWLQALAAFLVSGVLQVVLMLTHRELGWRIGMPRDLSIWMFIWPVAKLVAMVPISFGGLGVREAAFLGLARPFGIAESVAVASSLAWQAVALVGGLIGGGVWLLMTLRPERPLDRVERRLT
jgi:uncharacterized membrane protein YbhN (UPF0104 family)